MILASEFANDIVSHKRTLSEMVDINEYEAIEVKLNITKENYTPRDALIKAVENMFQGEHSTLVLQLSMQ